MRQSKIVACEWTGSAAERIERCYRNALHITAVECHRTSYRLKGSKEIQTDPMMIFTVYPMNLSEPDTHNLRLDLSFIPSPCFPFSHSFGLKLGLSIV